jgi:hypothetical protein
MARAPDGARFSAGGERVPRLARPSPGRRPGIRPRVGEDLADRRPLQSPRPGALPPSVELESRAVLKACITARAAVAELKAAGRA